MLEYAGGGAPTINHHAHFAQPATWPRGYPLEAIAAPLETAVREARVVPAVQQGLADGDPDMDAVFRVADRITVMVNGEVIASDVPQVIRTHPDVLVAYLGEGH